MHHVIIGNSASGIAAIEAIREHERDSKITVISDEPDTNYSRPLISYLLGKKLKLDNLSYRNKGFYGQKKAELLLSSKAEKLDIAGKRVFLSGGRELHYDKLLISTGGIPISPEIKGLRTDGVFSFIKLSEAVEIENYIKERKVKDALIIGGGLIGLKTCEALIGLNLKIAIVELSDRLLPATLDKKASKIIESSLKKSGCRLFLKDTVERIIKTNGKLKGAVLRSGKELKTDLVVVAVGVRPNIELVKGTGIKVNRGILVDNFMQTSAEGVFAAGDCCEAMDLLIGERRPIAIWPTAVRQGRIAGYNMAGIRKEYRGGFPMNSIELCGIPTISVGVTNPGGKGYEVMECISTEKSTYRKVVLKDERVVGAIFVGDIDRAGIYTGLIKDKVNASSFKNQLLDENFGLISLPEEYRKHLVSDKAPII